MGSFPDGLERKKGTRPEGGSLSREHSGVKLEDALLHHSLSNLLEASDVSTGNQVVAQAILLSSLSRDSVDGLHHLLQLAIDSCPCFFILNILILQSEF